MNAPISKRVQTILSDILNISPSEITPSLSPETVEAWDSLNHLNLVFAMEQEFQINFRPEEIEQLVSVDQITKVLDQKLTIPGDRRGR